MEQNLKELINFPKTLKSSSSQFFAIEKVMYVYCKKAAIRIGVLVLFQPQS